MNALDVANRFREQRYTPADIKSVAKALEDGNANFLHDVVASYIKYADEVDERALVRYLKTAKDFWPVHEIISGLSILRCKDSEFATEVLRYAKGVSWDKEDYARIAAIAAIPRIPKSDGLVQDVLKRAARSDNIVVRNTALEVAQELLGIPFSKKKRGLDDKDMMRNVPQEVREWLDLKSSDLT